MENWITDFLEQFGYLGVFLLICAENLFPPIPSEVILTFSGFMTSSTTLSVAGGYYLLHLRFGAWCHPTIWNWHAVRD